MASPLLISDPCPAKTRSDLEWDRLLVALSARCEGPMGKALALTWDFAETREGVRRRLARSREAADLYRNGEQLPVEGLPDVRDAVARLGVGGVLSGIELRGVGKLLAAARRLRRFVSAHRSTCPALDAALATDPTLDPLADEIEGSFDADGTLSDHASPALKELRAEQQQARARILTRLDDLMSRYDRVLQDHFVTERIGLRGWCKQATIFQEWHVRVVQRSRILDFQ